MSSQDIKSDAVPDPGFLTFYRSLATKPSTTIRFFDRGEYYTVHGPDAEFVAREIIKSSGIIKYHGQGSNRLEYINVNKTTFESTIKELLLVRQYRVEVYKMKNNKQTDWSLTYKASPGNLMQFEDLLYGSSDSMASSGILSVHINVKDEQMTVGVAYADSLTRRFEVCQFVDTQQLINLESVVVQLNAKECLLVSSENDVNIAAIRQLMEKSSLVVTNRKKSEFDNKDIEQDLNRLLKVEKNSQPNVSVLPELSNTQAMASLSAIIKYLELLSDESNFHQFTLTTFRLGQYMRLDASAARAVNLLPSPLDVGNQCQNLYALLNKCRTGPGQRMLAGWLHQPLTDMNQIEERLNIVEALVEASEVRHYLFKDHLRRLPDLQRLNKKFQRGKATLQDCYRVYQGIEIIPKIVSCLKMCDGEHSELLSEIFINPISEMLTDFSKYQEMIETTIDMEKVNDHEFMIKPDFDEVLQDLGEKLEVLEKNIEKELNKVSRDLGLEANKVLKLESNAQLGYYFRITRKEEKVLRGNRAYHIVDTNKNGVRFRNSSLSASNESYMKIKAEYAEQQKLVVAEVISIACGYVEPLNSLSDLLARLDVFVSFAQVSSDAPTPYITPKLLPQGSGVLRLKEARHPCLEMQDSVAYIPNDIIMNQDDKMFYLITGPNMGGKSTYIRSAGIIVLMAQLGCFVPCSSAEVSIVDAILARVGASDSQLKGVSTFMCEMLETASILKSATKNSLMIIDELGRGTSTYDGFGLAWAIAQHISTVIGGFCLFATHFHELTALADVVPQVGNLHVEAVTGQGMLTLLYRVKPGVCDQSFGIHVAELVHFPKHVIEFAREKATTLEQSTSMLISSSNSSVKSEISTDTKQVPKVTLEQAREFLRQVKESMTDEITKEELTQKINSLKVEFQKSRT